MKSIPNEWSAFYGARWREFRCSPRLPADPDGPAVLRVEPGEAVRVYAEGTVVVWCMATDCRPVREEIDVPAGGTVERTLALVR